MDPGSLIVMLILLALFAGAMYFGYQKVIVDDVFDLTQEPVEPSTPTEPSAPPSSSDVPGVDSVKGRPNGSKLSPSQVISYYGGDGDIIPKGQAKTASVCYEASKARGINNWAWDRKDKRCYAYTDSTLFTLMNDNTKIEDKSRYVVGCTEPGVTVAQGCTDFTGGNLVRGWLHGHVRMGDNTRTMSLEECRKYAGEQGYDSFMYASDRGWGPYCHYYPDAEKLRGWTGKNSDFGNISGCVDPSKKVINGCQ
jgi:hypothetical protein